MDRFDNVTDAVEYLAYRYGENTDKAIRWINRHVNKMVNKLLKALRKDRFGDYTTRLIAATNAECEFWFEVQTEIYELEEES